MLALLLHLPPVALLISEAGQQLLRLPLPRGVRIAHLVNQKQFSINDVIKMIN